MSKALTFGDQGPQFRALALLAETHPGLPCVYLSCSSSAIEEVKFMADSAAELEAWRTALGVPSDAVTLSDPHCGCRYMRFTAQFDSVDLMFSVALPVPELEGAVA